MAFSLHPSLQWIRRRGRLVPGCFRALGALSPQKGAALISEMAPFLRKLLDSLSGPLDFPAALAAVD